MKFSQLGLRKELLKSIKQLGYNRLTSIQEKALPDLLNKRDVLLKAQTGTGKTATFGISLLNNVNFEKHLQALIIVPTRELAVQISQELKLLGKLLQVNVQAIYGGVDIRHQIVKLKNKPQIVVGTPGRILDHINRHTLKLSNVNYLVVDEADEILKMGFIDDLEKIFNKIPSLLQTIFLSATLSTKLEKITNKFQHNPIFIEDKSKFSIPNTINQFYLKLTETEKFATLVDLLDLHDVTKNIIFCNTKIRAKDLVYNLFKYGFNAVELSGSISQRQRLEIIQKFEAGKIEFLVCTDVASRGIDISNVSYVYNYDFPESIEGYVHRIGRTGRLNNTGVSISFVTDIDLRIFNQVQRNFSQNLSIIKKPDKNIVLQSRIDKLLKNIDLNDEYPINKAFLDTAGNLLLNHDSKKLVAVLLASLIPYRKGIKKIIINKGNHSHDRRNRN